MNEITPHFRSFIEELDAAITEGQFELGEATVRWAHKAGELIRTYQKEHKLNLEEELLPLVSANLPKPKSPRTLFRWIQIYDREPDCEKLLASLGKNPTLARAAGKSLPSRTECPHVEYEMVHRCRNCKHIKDGTL